MINQGINMKIEPRWKQDLVIHCPDLKCRGMLLQSDFYHEMKCSKCGKLWMETVQWKEVEKLSIA